MVLTDINMPGMDGLTLLSKIDSVNSMVKTVIVSAYGDMENIRTAMNGGAFDFLIKPINLKDLEVTINKTLTHVKQLKENLRLRELEAIARLEAQQLKKSLQELQQNQAQLILTAKMSSLGQLVAGIAHEINNPVGFIYSNINHVNKYMQDLLHLLHIYLRQYPNPISEIKSEAEAIDLEFLSEDLPKILTSMKVGTDRIRQIVLSLRNFSRLDEAKMKLVDIHSGIDNALLILQHRLRSQINATNAIQVIKEYGKLPLVECYAGELNQVFMNILTNAMDALDECYQQGSLNELCQQPSTITIRTHLLEDNSGVVIQIRDNGMGMTAAVKDRIFEPFFTTKSVGSGTGLGLFVSYQIVVQKHGGVLKCFSEPGQGANFWIEIPIKQNSNLVTKGEKNESNGSR